MITIRHYREVDLEALVRLINEADALDRLDRGTSLEDGEPCPSRGDETRALLWVDFWVIIGEG